MGRQFLDIRHKAWLRPRLTDAAHPRFVKALQAFNAPARAAAVQTSSDDGGHPAPARAHHSKGLSSTCALKGFEWTGVRECFRPLTLAISKSSSVWSPDQEREALPLASDEKGPLSIARRRKR